jgi:hypothetical protein
LRHYLVPFAVGIMLGFAAVPFSPLARPLDCAAGSTAPSCHRNPFEAPLPAGDAVHPGRLYFGDKTIVI